MRDLLRRIAIHGGLTAFMLGIVGLMFAELAAIWLAGSPGVRTNTGEPIAESDADGAIAATLRARVPLIMAAWGFAFVAVGEVAVHLWRKRRTPPPAAPAQPDEAERLLEEILSQVESRQKAEAAAPVADPT